MFSETMVGLHGAEPAAVATAYDFAAFENVVDIGGATGNLLAAILNQHPKPHGILFDMPHVVRDAPALIEASGFRIASVSCPATFLRASQPPLTLICCHTSSTTGTKPSA